MKSKTKQRVMAVVMALLMTISLLPTNLLGGSVKVLAATTTYTFTPADLTDTDKTNVNPADGSTDSDIYIIAGTYKTAFTLGAISGKDSDAGKWRYKAINKKDAFDAGKSGNLSVKYTVQDATATAKLTVTATGNGGESVYTLLDKEGTVVKDSNNKETIAIANKTESDIVWEGLTASASPYELKMASGSGKKMGIYSIKAEETVGASTAISAPQVSDITLTPNSEDPAKVTISGTGVSGGEGSKYVVVRSDAEGNNEKKYTVDGKATSYSVEDTLDASGSYTYKAYGLGRDSAGADVMSEVRYLTEPYNYVLPLAKPVVAAAADNAKVTLSWGKVAEATSYDVRVYDGSTELTDFAKEVTELSVTYEGLTNGKTYGFVVIAKRSSTSSTAAADKVEATPVAPEAGVTWLKANDLDDYNSSKANYVVNSNWTLVPGGSSLKVEATSSLTSSDGIVFTKRISTGGSGSANPVKRAIELTIDKDSYVIIYAKSSGASRPLVIAKEGGEVVTQLNLAGKDDALEPSRAIELTAGKYYFYSTGGTGYVYGIKLGEGSAPRAAWSTVANPVIKSVTRSEDGKLTVSFDAVFGTDGADDGYVIMYQDGKEAASTTVSSNKDVTFSPITAGTFTFKVIIKRSGEADKESEYYTLNDYQLPPETPAITWVNNLGNGSVYVDYNNVATACTVWYKSEADADYIKAAENVTAGNYTFTGLTSGVKYDFKITATDEKGTATSEYKGFAVGDAAQQWYADVFGSATSGTITFNGESRALKSASDNNYPYPTAAPDMTNGGVIGIAASQNGKVADSEEGIQIYYTKINPNTENFKMTATFKVTDDSSVNNQSAYGIFAIDTQGIGTKDTKYFNSVSVGQFKSGTYGLYHANSARLITGYESYDTTSTAGSGRNMDNDNLFSKQTADDSSKVGDTYTYTLEKTNTGFIASMDGCSDTITFDDVHNVMVQEDGSVVVGVAVARVGVEISNITFEKTAGGAEAVNTVTKVEPSVKVFSSNVSGSTDYEFIAAPNVDGWLDVYNFSTSEFIYQGPVYADKFVKVPATLHVGVNGIKYSFKPSDSVKDLTTYGIIENELKVTVQQWGSEGETIYVSPNGNNSADGTRENPLSLTEALKYAQPGQTIVMLDGTYYIEKDLVIPRSTNGTADKPITLTAENVGSVIVDGSKQETSSSLLTIVGSYWKVYGIEFQNGLGKGVSVCGNYNTVEMCKIHNVANSGLQISRYAGEANDADMWPSYNLIKYCEAYDCCDAGRSDADGFAAKLTSGVGNKFYGCISHHNIDDGWDLYAKSTTGSIGAVTIENCVAYSNGFLTTDDPSTMAKEDFGEGNGFKLGGENMPGAHLLKNCISYNNAGKGITSNSGPDCQVINCTAYNNSLKGGTYNVSLYTKTSNPKGWVLDGMLSIAENGKTQAELGSSNGVINSLRSATNYLFDGAKSVNTEGKEATSDWFVSTDITIVPTITANGIDMHGLLELKDQSLKSGAKFTSWEASTKPGATTTVSGKNLVGGFGPAPGAGSGVAGVPNTGDTTPIMPLVILMVSSLLCMGYMARRKKIEE